MSSPSTSAPDLSGKIALVTGASRGIGRAIAKRLGAAGAHVIALARTVGGLEELDDEIKKAGGSATLIPADLADVDALSALAPALAQRFSKIDILVLNAGYLGELSPITDIDRKIWEQSIAVNLTANLHLLARLDPFLRASDAPRVIAITSRVGGETARAFWGPYAIAKAGLERLVETYAEESQSFGLKAAIIDPGAMRTRMRAQAMPGEDPSSLPDPEELTPLVFAAIDRDDSAPCSRLVFREWRGA